MRWSILALLLAAPALGAAQAPPAGSSEPFVVEYYYKTRWGFADEFIRLFKKNHFPVLQRESALGHIQRVTAEAPRFHGTEAGRWDYRVGIVGKNAAAPQEPFPEAELKRLFPDQDTFRREEQRRFEILAAHWDLPVVTVDLTRPSRAAPRGDQIVAFARRQGGARDAAGSRVPPPWLTRRAAHGTIAPHAAFVRPRTLSGDPRVARYAAGAVACRSIGRFRPRP